MPKKLFVSILRLIRETKGRFLSISAIVALGVAFFVGVSSSASIMDESVDVYNDQTGLKDITIYSDYGFDDDDVEAVRQIENVAEAEGTWFTDVMASSGKDICVTRVHGYSESQKINRFVLKEGRMPERPDEVLSESGSDLQQGFQIGTKVRLQTAEGTKNENLKYDEVTVVGMIDTPLYLNETKENSTLSNRYIETYLYIPAEAFDIDYYTELNILLKDAAQLDSFSDDYDDYAAENKERIEEIAETLKDRRYRKIKDEAEQEYADGLAEYLDGKETYETEIADAEQKIQDAEDELKDGREQIEDGKKELNDAERELAETEEEEKQKIQDALDLIDQNEKELQEQKKKAEQGRKEAEDGLAQIKTGREQIDRAAEQLLAAQEGLDQINDGIGQIDDALSSLNTLEEQLGKYADEAPLSGLLSEMPELKAALDALSLADDATVRDLKDTVITGTERLSGQKEELEGRLKDLKETLKAQGFTSDDQKQELTDALIALQSGITEAEDGLSAISEAEETLNGTIASIQQSAAFLDQYDDTLRAIEDAMNRTEGLAASFSDLPEETPLEILIEADPSLAEVISGAGLTGENTVVQLREYLQTTCMELQGQKEELQAKKEEILNGLSQMGFSSPQEALNALNIQAEELAAKKSETEGLLQTLRENEESLSAALNGYNQLEEGIRMVSEGLAELAAMQEQMKYLGDDALISDLSGLSPELKETAEQFGLSGDDDLADLLQAAAEKKQELADQKAGLESRKQEILDAAEQLGYKTPAEAAAALLKQKEDLSQKQKEVLAALAELDEADNLIADGEEQIKDARRQAEEGMKQLLEEIAKAQDQIREGWMEIAENEEKLKDGEKELADGKAELEDARREGREELDEAWAELSDARKEIDELEPNKWTVLDRKSHYASATYDGTIDQMASIGRVFPVFFILVAALVCLTTMTRMVDEQRGEIGILRALGYTKMQCASKYLIYAGSATVLGEIVGTIAGMLSFPIIIYHTWRMMYILPPVRMTIPWKLIGITAAAFLAAMLAATWAACGSDLTEVPSQLLRPKAPKLGRSMFLEKIGLIWNRLSFTWKVTLRNIFRYRSRFIMTVAGVAGCTALLLTGYGIRDSINSMVDIQFYDIYRFDGTAVLSKDAPEEEVRSVTDNLSAMEGIENLYRSYTYTAKGYGSGALSETMTVLVYSDPSVANEEFSLRTRIGKEPLSVSSDGVMINEKLAENLGVGVGDTFRMEDEDGVIHEVRVAAVMEMYIRHYVLMSEEYYRTLSTRPLSRTCIHIRLAEDAPENIQERIAAADGVDSIEFFDTVLNNFNTMVKSLDIIVWTLIISSMSLAAVVLGNLINVNISERQREIATLKVLGFRRGEVRNYIYKENNILTLIGTFCGMPLGTLLHHFIMRTVEMDYIMFGRDVLPMSYLISGALTVLFGIIVNHMMASRLDRIKMVESLKSVE